MSEETIKVELPEIPGFEHVPIGKCVGANDFWLTAGGLKPVSNTALGARVDKHHCPCYRRLPENPPLPTKEWCEKQGYEFPTECAVPTKDNCDAWLRLDDCVCSTNNQPYYAHTRAGKRRWLLRKKQAPLSFETWQGPLSIKARRKCDGRLVRIDAQPECLALEEPGLLACYEAPYAEVDEDYETLDGGRIGMASGESEAPKRSGGRLE